MTAGPGPWWDTTNERSVFEPVDWIRHCEQRSGRPAPSLPPAGVQLVLRDEFAHTLDRFGVDSDDFTRAGHPFAIVDAPPGPVVVAWSAKGSSAAGGLEEMIALGVRRVVVVGSAGALTEDHRIGDVVVATRARRDDGVSHHYQPAAPYAEASATLTPRLVGSLSTAGVEVSTGAIWSITAYFRQTPSRLAAFRDEGCIAVANETAAAFSIGAYRGVDVAAVCVLGDSIARGRFDTSGTTDARTVTAMVDAAIEAVVDER